MFSPQRVGVCKKVSELLEFFSLRMSSSRREMSQLVCSVKYVECIGKSKQDVLTDTW
jgi:hypothetical protein